MLLQTNSYIVPKERRAEHARLIRRFRQALARIGCDQFEVYEQVGANWSPGGANGRYVQIMRFRDRQHQQAVQAAEANDHGAQTIIAEFCELINFPYQQQHGYFATGFYTSVLPSGPRQAVEYESDESEDGMGGPAVADVAAPFGDTAGVQEVDASADESHPGPEAVSEATEGTSDGVRAREEPPLLTEAGKDPAQAESTALADELIVDNGGTGSSLGSFLDSMNEDDPELKTDAGDNGQHARFEEPQFGNPDPGFVEAAIPVGVAAPSATDDVGSFDAVAESGEPLNDTAHVNEPSPAAHPAPAASASAAEAPKADAGHGDERAGGSDEREALAEPASPSDDADTVDDFEMIDHGLLFEDELPGENSSSAAHVAEVPPSFGLDETATAPPSQQPVSKPVHHEPHEELMPTVSDYYSRGNGSPNIDSTSDDAALDALLDDASLLDSVPFPGALEEAPRLQSRRDTVAGNGHNIPADKEDDLLEIEAFIRQLEEEPSADNGRRAT